MPLNRSVFQDELDGVSQSLLDLTAMVCTAISEATTSVLNRDLTIAEKVIETDDRIDDMQHELDGRIITIIARQQPVATDLRALVTALRMSADLERMGDMAHHVAKITRMRHPETAIPSELIELIKNMGETALAIATKMGQVISTRNVDLAREVECDDDQMDQLHRQLISTLIAPQWSHGVESAIDLTLLGRYYERFADHAVSVSRRVHFLVTGNYS